jgi:hypothetical protein
VFTFAILHLSGKGKHLDSGLRESRIRAFVQCARLDEIVRD